MPSLLLPLRHASLRGFFFCGEAISLAEHDALLADANSCLAKVPALDDHFDQVISRYKEAIVPLSKWSASSSACLARLQSMVLEACGDAITRKPVHWDDPHVIELAAVDGHIGPHIDSVKNAGDIVASLSLASQRPVIIDCDPPATVHLPPRSLYVLSGPSRFEFRHSIAAGPQRRVSIVLRDEAPPPPWLLAARKKKAPMGH